MVADFFSKTQLDKLGERLRSGSRDERDLRALDQYRTSFRRAYESTIATIRTEFDFEATGRPAKTTTSIIDKLVRQHIRLTQIQDIAGIRLVVDSVIAQEAVVDRLAKTFAQFTIDDRRVTPSHGYRAVHVVVFLGDRHVEIQVRTWQQHRWAEVSEKISDLIDPAIKYGGGPQEIRDFLATFSDLVAQSEGLDRNHQEMLDRARILRRAAETEPSANKARFLSDAEELESEVTRQQELAETSLKHLAEKALSVFDRMSGE